MKSINLIIFILVIFFKTGNVLSSINLFDVNNIEVTNKSSSSNKILANQAIRKGFNELINRLILKEDVQKLKRLSFVEIKQLVSYYQMIPGEENLEGNKKFFNVSFDKGKLHNLFFKIGISYSNIAKNEFYLLPIFKKNDQFFIYSQNFFYEKWNEINQNELIEFILPIENIETIQKINMYKDNLVDLDINEIFKEYKGENIALVLIEDTNSPKEKIFLKTNIMSKTLSKNIIISKENLNQNKFYEKIIIEIQDEIINLTKSQNLIDVRTPSFINTKLNLDKKKNNLVELNRRLKKIDSIENIFVQEFNNQYVLLKIKYLGKVDKIIEQLKYQKIILTITGENWSIKII